MTTFLVAALMMGTVTAQAYANAQLQTSTIISKKKSEPAPKDRDDRQGGGEQPDPRQETYEGNGRDGATGGGSYCTFDCDPGDSGGGFIGEIFSPVTDGKTYPSKTKTTVEDRGEVLVYFTTVQEDLSASETCTTTIISVVDKSTGKTIKTDSDRFCNILDI